MIIMIILPIEKLKIICDNNHILGGLSLLEHMVFIINNPNELRLEWVQIDYILLI